MTGKDLAILSKLRQGFKVKQQKEKASWLEAMRQALNPEEKKVFSLMESFYNRYTSSENICQVFLKIISVSLSKIFHHVGSVTGK